MLFFNKQRKRFIPCIKRDSDNSRAFRNEYALLRLQFAAELCFRHPCKNIKLRCRYIAYFNNINVFFDCIHAVPHFPYSFIFHCIDAALRCCRIKLHFTTIAVVFPYGHRNFCGRHAHIVTIYCFVLLHFRQRGFIIENENRTHPLGAYTGHSRCTEKEPLNLLG